MSAAAPAAGASAAVSGTFAIAVLRWEHERQAAMVLSRAFVDDPLVTAICKAPAAECMERMRWGFRVALRSHCLAGQPAWMIAGAEAAPVGVVLATRAGGRAAPHATERSDLLFAIRGFWHVGLRAGLRGFKAAQIIAAQAPTEPFTYLRTLGVDPALHGRGLGSRLVEQVLHTAPPSLPVYLETAKERNLSFYARHGFACVGDFSCIGVRVWRLIRPATA